MAAKVRTNRNKRVGLLLGISATLVLAGVASRWITPAPLPTATAVGGGAARAAEDPRAETARPSRASLPRAGAAAEPPADSHEPARAEQSGLSSREVVELLRADGLLDDAEEQQLTELFTLALRLQESADGTEEPTRIRLQERLLERLGARLRALLGSERWLLVEPLLAGSEGSPLRVALE